MLTGAVFDVSFVMRVYDIYPVRRVAKNITSMPSSNKMHASMLSWKEVRMRINTRDPVVMSTLPRALRLCVAKSYPTDVLRWVGMGSADFDSPINPLASFTAQFRCLNSDEEHMDDNLMSSVDERMDFQWYVIGRCTDEAGDLVPYPDEARRFPQQSYEIWAIYGQVSGSCVMARLYYLIYE